MRLRPEQSGPPASAKATAARRSFSEGGKAAPRSGARERELVGGARLRWSRNKRTTSYGEVSP